MGGSAKEKTGTCLERFEQVTVKIGAFNESGVAVNESLEAVTAAAAAAAVRCSPSSRLTLPPRSREDDSEEDLQEISYCQ